MKSGAGELPAGVCDADFLPPPPPRSAGVFKVPLCEDGVADLRTFEPVAEGSPSTLRFLTGGFLTVAMPFRFRLDAGAGRFLDTGASVVGISAGMGAETGSSMDCFAFDDRSRKEKSFFAASMALRVSESAFTRVGVVSFTAMACAGVFSLGVPDGSSLM
jgi:hypothetical protein